MADFHFTLRAPSVQMLIRTGQVIYVMGATIIGSHIGIRELPADDHEIAYPATIGAAVSGGAAIASIAIPKPMLAFAAFSGIVWTSTKNELYRRQQSKK